MVKAGKYVYYCHSKCHLYYELFLPNGTCFLYHTYCLCLDVASIRIVRVDMSEFRVCSGVTTGILNYSAVLEKLQPFAVSYIQRYVERKKNDTLLEGE